MFRRSITGRLICHEIIVRRDSVKLKFEVMNFTLKSQIQQSVLGDSFEHRAIHDSRTNLDFVNAFHS